MKVTEIKLADWLLLFLRVCLFALAALILAGLSLPGLSSNNKTTAYISPAWLQNATPQTVSAVLQQYSNKDTSRIIVLQNGFPELDEQLAKQIRADAQPFPGVVNIGQTIESGQPTNIWPLLTERLSLEDHQHPVDVYAVDSLAQFGPLRPALPREVNWNLIQTRQDKNDSPVPVNAMVAFDSSRRADAEVFSKAFKSLKATRLPGLSWNMMKTGQPLEKQQHIDWLIVLSENEISIDFQDSPEVPSVMLTDAFGASRAIAPKQLRLPFYPFSEFRVSRTGSAVDDSQTLLNLPGNQPLLQQARNGNTREIHFNSRFIPTWSSIAQQPEFPQLLLQLMLSEDQQQTFFPAASVSQAQLETTISASAMDTPLPRRSLQSLLAVLMVLLWLSERWLSERKRRVQS